ncbi:DUF4893 domain-containing protein [Sphingomonas sp. ASV193]|uniref:DUF4893 domain-containing protein n=1 Tax=Sphingomonas sp. ASV193 TaxID=3144405 RepID=UPI0032E928F5
MKRLLPLACLLSLAACHVSPGPAGPVINADKSHDWRTVATDDDRARLREWRKTLIAALDSARKAGHGAEIDREGVLLQPDLTLGGAALPNGDYRCRVIKIGAKSEGMLDYVTYPAFTCRVQPERGLQGFAKLTGSQRPIGLIFPADAGRQVFLGTLELGDESRAMQYGRDQDRDLAAWIQRVDERRWRMLFPSPHFESQADVIELVPAP